MNAEVNSESPSHSARNSGVTAAPPLITNPSTSGRDQPVIAPTASHAISPATNAATTPTNPAPTVNHRRAADTPATAAIAATTSAHMIASKPDDGTAICKPCFDSSATPSIDRAPVES